MSNQSNQKEDITSLQEVVIVTGYLDYVSNMVSFMEQAIKEQVAKEPATKESLLDSISFQVWDLEELSNMELTGTDNMLFLADTDELIGELLDRGIPVAGYEHELNGKETMMKVGYVLSDLQELEKDDYLFLWKRVTGQPIEIYDTKRLRLRETTVEDVDCFYELYEAPSITRYMEPLYENIEEERAYQESYIRNIYELYGYGIWTVVHRETNTIIGRVGVAPREGCEEPEIGFVIGVEWQGQGYAYEACLGALAYVEQVCDIRKVIAVVHEDNIPSRRLVEKLGFVLEDRVLQENHVTYVRTC